MFTARYGLDIYIIQVNFHIEGGQLPCPDTGLVGRQIGTATGSSPSTSVSPVSIIPATLHTHLHLNTGLLRRTREHRVCTGQLMHRPISNSVGQKGPFTLPSFFQVFDNLREKDTSKTPHNAIQAQRSTIALILAPVIGCRMSLVIDLTLRPLYTQEKSPRYAITRRLCRPQGRFWRFF